MTKIKNIPYLRSYLMAGLHAMLVLANGRFDLHTNGTQAFTALATIIMTVDELGDRLKRKP